MTINIEQIEKSQPVPSIPSICHPHLDLKMQNSQIDDSVDFTALIGSLHAPYTDPASIESESDDGCPYPKDEDETRIAHSADDETVVYTDEPKGGIENELDCDEDTWHSFTEPNKKTAIDAEADEMYAADLLADSSESGTSKATATGVHNIVSLIEPLQTDTTDTTDITDATHSVTLDVDSSALTKFRKAPETGLIASAIGNHLPDRKAAGRVEIQLREGYLQEIMRSAEACLASTGLHFQRAGAIVAVSADPDTQEAVIQELHTLALVHALDGVSAWMRPDKRNNSWVQTDPSERICHVMVKTGRFQHLAVLKCLTRQPFLRSDGSLCSQIGYEPATASFGVFKPEEYDVPDQPTRQQAMDALALLDELLDEFAFAMPHDRSAALSGMLTAVVRVSLPLAPMFHVRAAQIGSGKSYLCELIAALATPQRGTPVGFPIRDEECTKLLLAQLARAPAVIEFDNLTSDLKPHKSLCTALTSERMEGRILGRTKIIQVGTQVMFLSSGNNVGPIGDMTRRCLTINLDPACEVPATRTFQRPHLIDDVRKDRCRYVSAALTVVRGWIVASDTSVQCKPLASYSRWSDWCRLPLIWLGHPDPATAVFESMDSDPERQLLGRLLCLWKDEFCGESIRVRDVVERTKAAHPGTGELTEVLLTIAGDRDKVNNRKLGHWITRHAGQVVDGNRLSRAPKTSNVESWRVESVMSVMSVAVVTTAPVTNPVTSTVLGQASNDERSEGKP